MKGGLYMLKLYPLFGAHCVLPMDRELRIFGFADPGETVTVQLLAKDRSVVCCGKCAAEGGRFLAFLPAVSVPMTGLTLRAAKGSETCTAEDVAVGLVFLAGGQSNMELPLCNANEGKAVIAAHQDDLLRWYMVPKVSIPADVPAAEEKCAWQAMAPGSCPDMSGVGYFFGAKLRRLMNIPIGIVGCYWGGTSVTAWMDEEALNRLDEGKQYLDRYTALVGDKTMARWLEEEKAFEAIMDKWNSDVARVQSEHPGIVWDDIEKLLGKCPWNPPAGPGSFLRPAGLAETMVKRIVPAALTAILFYQGESDVGITDHYDLLLEMLIRRWRELFRNAELPFINMQLPMYLENNQQETPAWPEVRMAQDHVWKQVRGTALTCLIDCGEFNNIHPTDKRTPGERMADEYLAFTGDKAAAYRMPPRAVAKWAEDSTLLVRVSEPVHIVNGSPDLFEIAGDDGVFHPAEAVLRCGTVIALTSDEVQFPVSARYAHVCYAKVHVFGDNGMPLRPFVLF